MNVSEGNQELIGKNEPFKIFPHLTNIIRQFGTIDNDDLVTGNIVLAELARTVLWRMRKLDLVQCPSGLVAEIDVPVGYFPLGRNIVFELPKNPEQRGFGHKMPVGFAV